MTSPMRPPVPSRAGDRQTSPCPGVPRPPSRAGFRLAVAARVLYNALSRREVIDRVSYKRPNTGDPELDKKLIAEDYDMLFPRLLDALRSPADAGDQRFEVWLDKLALIDEDRVSAYMLGIWDTLDRGRRAYVRLRLGGIFRELPRE